MTLSAPSHELLTALQHLADGSDAPPSAKRQARDLRARLMTPVRVAVLGPSADLSVSVREQLDIAVAAAVGTQAALVSIPFEDTAIHLDNMDMAIWCTVLFDDTELAAWSAAPDVLRDHSALAVLCVDDTAMLQRHTSDYGDEFATFLALNFAAEEIDVTAVAAWLTKDLVRGRTAEIEAAEVLLQLHHIPVALGTAPAVAVPTPNVSGDINCVLAVLRGAGVTMTEIVKQNGEACASEVMEVCIDTAEQLLDDLSGAKGDALANDVAAASDAITLMSLEGEISSAVDAVTVLAQIRLELEHPHAA